MLIFVSRTTLATYPCIAQCSQDAFSNVSYKSLRPLQLYLIFPRVELRTIYWPFLFSMIFIVLAFYGGSGQFPPFAEWVLWEYQVLPSLPLNLTWVYFRASDDTSRVGSFLPATMPFSPRRAVLHGKDNQWEKVKCSLNVSFSEVFCLLVFPLLASRITWSTPSKCGSLGATSD